MPPKPKTKPWMKKSAKKKSPTTLTKASKAAAKTRAKKADRAYPNLVDNMWAAQKQKKKSDS